MFLVEGLFAALAIVDINGPFEISDIQVAESLTTEVIERAVCRDCVAGDRLMFLAFQMEMRGRCIDIVEVPRSCRHIDAGAVGHAVLVNPELVFVGRQPA